MLFTVDGKQIRAVPHAASFAEVGRALGPGRLAEVHGEFDRMLDELPPDRQTKRRTFSSSWLASNLTPWPHPLSHLYFVSREILGPNADESIVQERAALAFGLFAWECVMNRAEKWIFYDPNISSTDPNREVTGKVYFESDV